MKKFICYNLWLGIKTFANTKLATYFMCDTNTKIMYTGCNYIGMIILHEVLLLMSCYSACTCSKQLAWCMGEIIIICMLMCLAHRL